MIDNIWIVSSYAARARQIQNKAIINKVDSVQGEVYQLRAQVTALQAQLRNVSKDGSAVISPNVPSYQSKIYELSAEIVSIQRQKFDLIEEFDDELSKKDDLLRRVWEKISGIDMEQDEVYCELEKHAMSIMAKEEQADTLEQSTIVEGDESKTESAEKTNFLKCLREELRNKEAHLQQMESIDLTVLHQYEEKNRELLQRIKELEDEKYVRGLVGS